MGYILGTRNGGGCCNHRSLKGGIRFDRIRICQRWWLVNLPSPGLVQGLLKSVVSLHKALLNIYFRGEYVRGGEVDQPWVKTSHDIDLFIWLLGWEGFFLKGSTNHPSPPQKTEPTMKKIPPFCLGIQAHNWLIFEFVTLIGWFGGAPKNWYTLEN